MEKFSVYKRQVLLPSMEGNRVYTKLLELLEMEELKDEGVIEINQWNEGFLALGLRKLSFSKDAMVYNYPSGDLTYYTDDEFIIFYIEDDEQCSWTFIDKVKPKK